jgi:hypothetical protein
LPLQRSRPAQKRACRTDGPFVIDAFFVRTADNSVLHHNGPSSSRVGEREHFFCYAGIITDIGPFGEPASKVCDIDILSRHDADGELGGSCMVWTVEGDSRNGVAAKSSRASFGATACVHAQPSVRCRASTTLAALGLRVQIFTGSERSRDRRLGWRRCISAVGLRLGRIVTFCCSLSRLAAVQGSSLIVSLSRFVRCVERSEFNTRTEGNAGLSVVTNNPQCWCLGRSRSRPSWVLAGAVSDRWRAYPSTVGSARGFAPPI